MLKKLYIFVYISLAVSLRSGERNFRFQTAGGKMFWTDVKVVKGWRIQQNILTGHCRLLNPAKVRYKWGTKAACVYELSKYTSVDKRKKTVVLIHGLGLRKESLKCLVPLLEKEGFQTVQFGYSAMLEPLESCADKLNSVLQDYEGELFFVTHSMGGILLRQYQQNYRRSIKSAVLLTPPSNGAQIVDFMKQIKMDSLLGVNGKRLNTSCDGLPAVLPPLTSPFITIAGIKKTWIGYFPLYCFMLQDNDGYISTETTVSGNEVNHFKIADSHLRIMKNASVQKIILTFLNNDKLL